MHTANTIELSREGITDSHAHLTGDELWGKIEDLVARAHAANVKRIVNICTDERSLERGLELAKRHPWIFNTAATTPHDVEKEGESFFPLAQKHVSSLVAIGETGLDYHYQHSPREIQQKFLRRYIELAKKHALPLVFHCREAFPDLFAITQEMCPDHPCLLHCFTGGLQEARLAVKRGWKISFSGIVTFKKSEELRLVAKEIPLEHILVETDAPYLAPQSLRGRENEPAFIRETVECLANLRGIAPGALAEKTSANAETFFPFSKAERSV